MYWKTIRWGGTALVVIVAVLAALESNNKSTTRGGNASGAYQSSPSANNALRDFRLNR